MPHTRRGPCVFVNSATGLLDLAILKDPVELHSLRVLLTLAEAGGDAPGVATPEERERSSGHFRLTEAGAARFEEPLWECVGRQPGAETGPDVTTLYGRLRTIRTIWTTPQVSAVQSDVAFSGSYEKRPLELGKLMLYQCDRVCPGWMILAPSLSGWPLDSRPGSVNRRNPMTGAYISLTFSSNSRLQLRITLICLGTAVGSRCRTRNRLPSGEIR